MNPSSNPRRLRIFCASPGDVAEERKRVHEIIDGLNRSGQLAQQHGLVFEVLDWQTHVSPAMGRPEGVTLEQLQPEAWDIFVGVLWLRFGSATGANDPRTGAPFESGTHEEFVEAYSRWQKSGKPRIWFYQCKRSPEDIDDLDPEQYKRVKDFFKQCRHDGAHPGFYRTYQSPEEFSHKLRDDLEKFILAFVVAPSGAAPKGATTSPKQVEQHRRRYLDKLSTECNRLPLAAIAEDRQRHTNAQLTLNKVYIGLNTEDRVDANGNLVTHESRELSSEEQKKIRSLTALEAANRYDPLVILGEPGSGKSSFLNYLLSALAAKQLEPASPLQIDWPHGDLFPVRILLRKLAVFLQKENASAWLDKSPDECERELCRLVYQHLAETLLECEAQDFSEALRERIEARRCLIVFDGLDETPPNLRLLITRTVQTFCKHIDKRSADILSAGKDACATGGNRFLITCRNRSYEGDTVLPGYKTVKLAAFDDEQVQSFAARWYEALVQLEQFTPSRGEEKRDDLLDATKRLPESMVRNPLLLTTIANIHANNVELPRQRVKLYQKASELLLKRWQEEKAGKLGLFEELGLKDDSKVYHALWELGHYAQNTARAKDTADIPESAALKILRDNFAGVPQPWAAAEKLLAYVDETAGLLLGHGGVSENIYSFPHRTFQEYFAGCFLAKRSREFKRQLQDLLAEGDYWRLTAQLGLEEVLHNDRNDLIAMDAAYSLCSETEPQLAETEKWRGALWAANFALEIGVDLIAQDKATNGGKAFLTRLQNRLVTILEKSLLPARERAEAGFALGKLGDPRPGVCGFPLEWIALPGGRFTMGDEKYGPAHEVELSSFKISKYLITNAQFAAFMKAGGYHEKQWWSEEGWKYREQYDWKEPRLWDNGDFNLPNQPVVGVSWFEAEAFCAWLSAEGKKIIVRLPTEAEWEFAARGSAGRIFPWSDEAPNEERANYEESKIGRTTAVGTYPLGATPEGICDLAGNVWEWCGDWYGGDYYAACKKKGVVKNPRGPAQPEQYEPRVIRGGSYWNDANGLRGSRRYGNYPDNLLVFYGFRVSAGAS